MVRELQRPLAAAVASPVVEPSPYSLTVLHDLPIVKGRPG